MHNIAIIGAGGAIGAAFCAHYGNARNVNTIFAFSRSFQMQETERIVRAPIDFDDMDSVARAADIATSRGSVHRVIVASGILHENGVRPEKSLRHITEGGMARNFHINCIGPALVARHFIPKMDRDAPTVFAALSARVGSISDNALGGWYAYRASKAALNMTIKCLAIECARRWPQLTIVGLHPGTVDSALSAPFQRNVPEGKLWSPARSVSLMTKTLEGLAADASGKCFAWDGAEIPP